MARTIFQWIILGVSPPGAALVAASRATRAFIGELGAAEGRVDRPLLRNNGERTKRIGLGAPVAGGWSPENVGLADRRVLSCVRFW